MGFRGEALAAIASVAEVSITSRTAAPPTPCGWTRAAASCSPPRARGTTVEVHELFFNTPARRKFLKSDATELAHALDAVRRHALARPDVGFAVWHEGRLVAQWRAVVSPLLDDAATQRLGDVLGADFIAASRVAGRAARAAGPGRPRRPPEAARSRADQQYLFVNGRFVRDRLIATPCAAPTTTSCTAAASRPTRCSCRSTRAGRRQRAPDQDRGALPRRPRGAPGAVHAAVQDALALTARPTRGRSRAGPRQAPDAQPRPPGRGLAGAAGPGRSARSARRRLGPARRRPGGCRRPGHLGRAAPAARARRRPAPPRRPRPGRWAGPGADRRRLRAGRERAGPGHRRHARRARAHRLRALKAAQAGPGPHAGAAAADSGELRRHARRDGHRRGRTRSAAGAGPGRGAAVARRRWPCAAARRRCPMPTWPS
jgi:hypothetical protein